MLNNIQNLRALAASAVVAYHCLIRFLHPADPLGRSYLDLPSGGVDLFFLISGFVMVHTTRDDETPAWFATKRIARIVPLYAPVAERWLQVTLDPAVMPAGIAPGTVPTAALAGAWRVRVCDSVAAETAR